jgi:uncharacterized SAM-binding protein YcdF (DUF218 family)
MSIGMKNYKEIEKTIIKVLIKLLKWFFISFGGFAFLFFVLSFTDLPYYAYHWLGTSNSKIVSNPDLIVILGGGGMPSPDGLVRTYYGAEMANAYPLSHIVIALPLDEEDSLYQLDLMAGELRLKGIDSMRISFEPYGFNTHSQAENLSRRYKNDLEGINLLIVTTPEHMYRAVKSFKKAGFVHVSGCPTFENPVDAEKVKDKQKTKDVRVKSLTLRYNMWSYMNYELLVIREYCAIVYYKLKGWI